MNTKIIIDSTADIKAEISGGFLVVPLTVNFGEQEYIDKVTITHTQFYEKLIESDVLPTTSQASPAAFEKVFQNVGSEGAVVITLSKELSGTYQSAVIAAQTRKDIYVVDSLSASIGTGILCTLALSLANEGRSAKEIANILTAERQNICLVGMLDTLEYLKKGGRISKTAAYAAGVLNIKPVITVKDGVVAMLGKARGSRQGNNLLVKEIEKAGGIDFTKPLLLGYTGLDNKLLIKYMEDSRHLWEHSTEKLDITPIGSVIGTHGGPGAIAVAFFKKH